MNTFKSMNTIESISNPSMNNSLASTNTKNVEKI